MVPGSRNRKYLPGAITAVVPDRIPAEKRGTALAIVSLGTSFGWMLGYAIGKIFIHQPLLDSVLVGGFLVIAAISFFFLAPDRENLPATPSKKTDPEKLAGSFFSSLASYDFRYAFIGRLLFMLGYLTVQGYYFYLLEDYIDIQKYSLLAENGVLIMIGISTVAGFIAASLGGFLSDRTGRRKAFVIAACILTALAMVLPLLWPTWTVMILFSVLIGTGFGLNLAVSTALVTLVLPKAEDHARYMGILNIANAGPMIIAPLIAAWMINSLGIIRPCSFEELSWQSWGLCRLFRLLA